MQENSYIRKNYDLLIGIDCGVNTGFAIWNTRKSVFETVISVPIHRAMFHIIELNKSAIIKVFVEDARLRKWLGKKNVEVLQGAGSIKRDSKIWDDFLYDFNIDYELIAPRYNKTKLNAQQFKIITNYKEKTNSHSRDAAMLVFQHL